MITNTLALIGMYTIYKYLRREVFIDRGPSIFKWRVSQ